MMIEHTVFCRPVLSGGCDPEDCHQVWFFPSQNHKEGGKGHLHCTCLSIAFMN